MHASEYYPFIGVLIALLGMGLLTAYYVMVPLLDKLNVFLNTGTDIEQFQKFSGFICALTIFTGVFLWGYMGSFETQGQSYTYVETPRETDESLEIIEEAPYTSNEVLIFARECVGQYLELQNTMVVMGCPVDDEYYIVLFTHCNQHYQLLQRYRDRPVITVISRNHPRWEEYFARHLEIEERLSTLNCN